MTFSAEAAALLVLMALHLAARQLRFLEGIPRSRWLSAAGGVSVAYVLVHLLPELAAGQQAVERDGAGPLDFLEDHVYLLALAGLASFYGVEVFSRRESGRRGGGASARPDAAHDTAFWLSMASFALYNAVIGYLIVHRDEQSTWSLAAFTIALGLHFVVNDHALRARHRDAYDELGRWLLVGAVAAGWAAGELTEISEAALGLLIAFIAGGVILNVIKEELPEERQSRFSAFLVGAIGYAVLLQLG